MCQMIDAVRKLDLIDESTKDLAHLGSGRQESRHPAPVRQDRRDCDKATSQTVEAATQDAGPERAGTPNITEENPGAHPNH